MQKVNFALCFEVHIPVCFTGYFEYQFARDFTLKNHGEEIGGITS